MISSFSENRPWGRFVRFTTGDSYETVKLLYVSSGQKTSLQYHHKRQEFWRVISGNPTITIGEETTYGKEGDEFSIDVEQRHRIFAEVDDVIILEISSGDFDENDIVRVEDDYGRADEAA